MTRSVNPRDLLHTGEIAVKLATAQVVTILEDMSNARGNDIAKPGLRGLVDAGSKAMKAKMRGKVTVIKLLSERVHMQ